MSEKEKDLRDTYNWFDAYQQHAKKYAGKKTVQK